MMRVLKVNEGHRVEVIKTFGQEVEGGKGTRAKGRVRGKIIGMRGGNGKRA